MEHLNHEEYQQPNRDRYKSGSDDAEYSNDFNSSNSHMIIKNLVIENANLQNCNIFIQGNEKASSNAMPISPPKQ